jgi:5'-3' exonuclease
MGEVLLPFIEEDRLLKELEKHYHKLTVEELKRNKLKKHQVFISKQN